jgi:hypothetical protein
MTDVAEACANAGVAIHVTRANASITLTAPYFVFM